jgi:hypothetical protein
VIHKLRNQEYDGAELRSDPRSRNPEDFGVTPIWIVSRPEGRQAVGRAIHA